MMRRAALLLLALALPAAIVAQQPPSPAERARAQAAAAERRQAALERAAEQAGDEAAALRQRQRAALAGIAAIEARITAADLELARARAEQRASEARLAAARAPAAALVAGVVTMGRQPPLMVLADGASVDELVRLRALLDHGLPAIRARSAGLARQSEAARRGAAAVGQARRVLSEQAQALDAARTRFAALEQQAAGRAQRYSANAFLAGDRVLAGDEEARLLTRAESRAAEARRTAALLARLEPLPARPGTPPTPVRPPFAFRLPADAPVTAGMGTVSEVGVTARGLTLDTRRGAPLAAPADGTILFAGPYRRQDGIVIIDHGGGWTSLVTGVRASAPRATRVRLGEPLGNALGPIEIELRNRETLVSPALIARSSVLLSNGLATR